MPAQEISSRGWRLIPVDLEAATDVAEAVVADTDLEIGTGRASIGCRTKEAWPPICW
jgi:hypothetical protein